MPCLLCGWADPGLRKNSKGSQRYTASATVLYRHLWHKSTVNFSRTRFTFSIALRRRAWGSGRISGRAYSISLILSEMPARKHRYCITFSSTGGDHCYHSWWTLVFIQKNKALFAWGTGGRGLLDWARPKIVDWFCRRGEAYRQIDWGNWGHQYGREEQMVSNGMRMGGWLWAGVTWNSTLYWKDRTQWQADQWFWQQTGRWHRQQAATVAADKGNDSFSSELRFNWMAAA